MDTEKLNYSIKETAALLDVGVQAIYNAINNGDLQSYRIGGRRFISPTALKEYLEARERAGHLERPCQVGGRRGQKKEEGEVDDSGESMEQPSA